MSLIHYVSIFMERIKMAVLNKKSTSNQSTWNIYNERTNPDYFDIKTFILI